MSISPLLDYSLPVVGIELCVVWMTVHYLLEPYGMPRVFGHTYTSMDFVARRSLTNHVVSLFLKIVCWCGAHAIWQAFFANRPLYTPIKHDDELRTTFTIGDVLAFCYLTVPTIYLFEIIYRANISVVSAIHHVGAISINVMGLIIVLMHNQRGFIAETEFKLILIYGSFEMVFEMFPHMAVILYRTMRHRSALLHKVFLGAALGIFTGTFTEQLAIGYFYYRVWKRFPTPYKVIGLILHACFMTAQLHGGRVCLQIARKMAKEAKAKDLEKQEDAGGTPVSQIYTEEVVTAGQVQAAKTALKHRESGSTAVATELPDYISTRTLPVDMALSTDGVDVTDSPREDRFPTRGGEDNLPQESEKGTTRTPV